MRSPDDRRVSRRSSGPLEKQAALLVSLQVQNDVQDLSQYVVAPI